MEEFNRALGILDSGVGGLTVTREIFEIMPAEDIIYYGDTLHLPYGSKDLAEIRVYVTRIIKYLVEVKKVKAVIIACNTATAAALNQLKKKFDIPIFGVIDSAAAKAAASTKNNQIGVIGTEATLASGEYQKAIKTFNQESSIFTEACPNFVKLVEEGKFNGSEVLKTVNFYLSSLAAAEIDSLILGCTHFPYLTPILTEVMGKKVKLINPAQEMAFEVKKHLKKLELLKTEKSVLGKDEFIVSDKSKISQRFLENGAKFLELEELEFKEENIFAN